MDRKQLTIFLVTAVFFAGIANMPAKADDDEKVMPLQITFVYPLGTNGTAAANTINHFSLNLLWGASGGVRGAEVAGLLNITNGTIVGAQAAGLGNIASGNVRGAQIGGILNTAAAIKGVQAAGIINISSKESNQEDDEIQTWSTGAQISGLLNIQDHNMKGTQAAGLMNLHAASFQGAQIAGLANNNQEEVKGAQIAGLLNKTKKLSGVQIGLINIADTVEKGVQVGLINIAQKGYSTLEIESNESFYTNISYKMGVKRFYSIFSIAYKDQNGKPLWAPGFGFGTAMSLGQKTDINFDLVSFQVNEDEWWTNRHNQLNKLKINASYRLSKKLALYGGVSVNVLVTEIKDDEGIPYDRLFKPRHSYLDETHKNTRVIIFPGINAGIRF